MKYNHHSEVNPSLPKKKYISDHHLSFRKMSKASDPNSWQKNVSQDYRTEQVKMISQVLASLEPSATPESKLMLASQFETAVFKSAPSLEEYGKIIQKKLKKMQKNYKPPAALSNQQLEEQNKEKITQTKRRLKAMYVDKLQLIVLNGKATVTFMKSKGDIDKAITLGKHIDDAILWAAEIGAVPIESAILINTGNPPVIPFRNVDEQLKRLENIENYLKTRLENIRGYVLKTTLLDQFFGEKLEEMERDIILNPNTESQTLLLSAMQSALEKEGLDLKGLTGISDVTDSVQQIKERLRKIQSIIPIARSRSTDDQKEAMLAYIDRIRDICQIFLIGTSIDPQDSQKLDVSGSFRKAHEAFNDAKTFLKTYYSEDSLRGEDDKSQKILLEDAWNKVLNYDTMNEIDTSVLEDDTANKEQNHTNKFHRRLATETKILFTPHKPVPYNLATALKRKQVEICKNGLSTYLNMKFDSVFEINIYFCPLLVCIRSLSPSDLQRSGRIANTSSSNESYLNIWKAPIHGIHLTPISRRRGVASKKHTLSGKVKEQVDDTTAYGAGGIVGNYTTVREIISKRLEYSSARATRCLRRCFAEKVKDGLSDFDIEISEGMALLKFIDLARLTYNGPQWRGSDDDVF